MKMTLKFSVIFCVYGIIFVAINHIFMRLHNKLSNMKLFFRICSLFLLSTFLFACQPLSSLKIDTLVPASIDFPGSFNKLLFVNLDSDINNDGKIDTVLYNIISNEMNLGFLEAINSTASIDSSRYLYVKGFLKSDKLYRLDTISWNYLEYISGNINADVFIVLDSVKLIMGSGSNVDYSSYPTEYIKYRDIAATISWSVYDLVEKKRLDQYVYSDTLYWESVGYSEAQVKKDMPSLEQSLRELSFFAAFDYGKRILPGWKRVTRYYYILGNKDFKKAALLINENDDWEAASVLWKKYINHSDAEVASRACFNLALANEMAGNFDQALVWAKKSTQIKSKTRTRQYISILITRKRNIEKLQNQL